MCPDHMWCPRICRFRAPIGINMSSGFRGERRPYGRGGGRGRGGRPSGLSGKEIGMYYKNLSQAKKKDTEKKERAVVTISREMQSNITGILQDLSDSQNNNPQVTYSPPLDVDNEMDITDCSSIPPSSSSLVPSIIQFGSSLDETLKSELLAKQGQPSYDKMQVFRHQLPSWHMKNDILTAVSSNQVVVISGETGCGKTTQISQFILDNSIMNGCGSKCNIICSQPRRISAITVAERVAAERGESLGNSVGYQIRLEGSLPRSYGSITYCTTGVMVRRMIGDPLLNQFSHIILDEVHERNNISDFLSIIVKDILPQRPDLKVILMSATINADLFSNYFGKAPIISIPGRVFPVQEFYLEDVLQMTRYLPSKEKEKRQVPIWVQRKSAERQQMLQEKQREMDQYIISLENENKYSPFVTESLKKMNLEDFDLSLILNLLKHICINMEDGAILVFLPGWDTISKLHDMLQSDVMFRKSSRYLIIPLHSLMPTSSQKQVFERPPSGVRKIIIATNIAETSITIDDVVFVVDCGKVKETTYDASNQLACLQAVWISKAAAKQRRGRAGRVQAGYCFHLFTKLQHANMADFQTPEMLRTPLEELILQIKILKLGLAEQFLEKAIEPPPGKSVHNAIMLLKDLQAITSTEDLTPLGYHLANLPVHPRIGRIILFAAMFSCLNPVLTIASTLGFKEPFVIPLHKQEEADRIRLNFAKNSESDHVALLKAFEGWEKVRYSGDARKYCWDHFLSSSTLEMLANMKNQFASLLNDIGFISDSNPKNIAANFNSENIKLVKAVLCAGLYPNVAKIQSGKREAKFYTQSDGKVKLHPKSVNTNKPSFSSSFLIYHTKVKSSAIFLHDSTVIPPFPLLFFGGDISVERDEEQETVTVDKWIKFQAPAYLAQMFKDIRRELDLVLEQKIAQPNMNLYCPLDKTPPPCSKLIQTIIELITSEDYSDQNDRIARGKHLYYRK